MTSNIYSMFFGNPNKRLFLLMVCVFLRAGLADAQYSHKFELTAEKTFSIEFDKLKASKGYINYYENNNRTGGGVMVGLKYHLDVIPMSFYAGYEYAELLKSNITSNLNIYEKSQSFKMHSADFNIQYSFLKRSSFSPFVLLGINLNHVNYERNGATYSYIYIDKNKNRFAQIDEVKWGYDRIQTAFNAVGVNAGAGMNIRLSDKIGLSGSFKFRYIPQQQTEWLDNTMLIGAFSVGGYYRFSKRDNTRL